jgi:hypothetical protein
VNGLRMTKDGAQEEKRTTAAVRQQGSADLAPEVCGFFRPGTADLPYRSALRAFVEERTVRHPTDSRRPNSALPCLKSTTVGLVFP